MYKFYKQNQLCSKLLINNKNVSLTVVNNLNFFLTICRIYRIWKKVPSIIMDFKRHFYLRIFENCDFKCATQLEDAKKIKKYIYIKIALKNNFSNQEFNIYTIDCLQIFYVR